MNFEKLRLREAICENPTWRDAYKDLIAFDTNLSSDYDGFAEACERVGLAALSEAEYDRLWREIEDNDLLD